MVEHGKVVHGEILIIVCFILALLVVAGMGIYFSQNSGHSTYAVEFVDGKVHNVWGGKYGNNQSFTRKLGSRIVYIPIQGEVKKCFINAAAANGKKAKINACLSYSISNSEGVKAFYQQKGITPETNIHEYFRGRMELELESAVIIEMKKAGTDAASGRTFFGDVSQRLEEELRELYKFEQKNETADCCQKYITFSKESLISLDYVRTYVNWEN